VDVVADEALQVGGNEAEARALQRQGNNTQHPPIQQLKMLLRRQPELMF
jgi:hypothetical protein